MSRFRVSKHWKIHPSTERMKNNLRTVGYTSLKIYRVQVVWIEADYCFPLTAQDGEVLEGIQ